MKSQSHHISLRGVEPIEFEKFVADLWAARGWNTTVSPESSDMGIDVVATRDEPFAEKQLIQAKKYGENNSVGSPEIQQYSSLKHQEPGVDTVVVVTTSQFSSQAKELAERLNVKLVDSEGLSTMIDQNDATGLVRNYTNESKSGTEKKIETSQAADTAMGKPADEEMGTGEALISATRLILILGVLGYVFFYVLTNLLL